MPAGQGVSGTFAVLVCDKMSAMHLINIRLESWAALAPGLDNKAAWQQWLQHPQVIEAELGKVSLKQIPPILRRRFGALGKCAVGAALPLLQEGESIPAIFASRHGDTALTLSLLEEMGRDEPMSPTGFSLAVHNAVSGLFSIARKDTSEVTAIAATQGLVLQALLEAAGQLLNQQRVLCVIYDVPLPELYQNYTAGDPFPYAIAMILSKKTGESLCLQQCSSLDACATKLPATLDTEPLRFLEFLAGISPKMCFDSNTDSGWQITRVSA